MTATVNGSVLSSLFFEHANAQGDQEGLLLGRVVSHVSDVISDSQINNQKEETTTYIHGFVPCPRACRWYDGSGRIVQDLLRKLLDGSTHKEVVGWYKFRRNSSLKPSLRETNIHSFLKEAFPGIHQKDFLFALFSFSVAPNLALHTFDHTFFNYGARGFLPVPISVINLGETAMSEYKFRSTTSASSSSSLFKHQFAEFHNTFLDSEGKMHQVNSIRALNTSLQDKLLGLCDNLIREEQELDTILQEVKTLQHRCDKSLQIRKKTGTNEVSMKPTTETPSMDTQVVSLRAETAVTTSPAPPCPDKREAGSSLPLATPTPSYSQQEPVKSKATHRMQGSKHISNVELLSSIDLSGTKSGTYNTASSTVNPDNVSDIVNMESTKPSSLPTTGLSQETRSQKTYTSGYSDMDYKMDTDSAPRKQMDSFEFVTDILKAEATSSPVRQRSPVLKDDMTQVKASNPTGARTKRHMSTQKTDKTTDGYATIASKPRRRPVVEAFTHQQPPDAGSLEDEDATQDPNAWKMEASNSQTY